MQTQKLLTDVAAAAVCICFVIQMRTVHVICLLSEDQEKIKFMNTIKNKPRFTVISLKILMIWRNCYVI